LEAKFVINIRQHTTDAVTKTYQVAADISIFVRRVINRHSFYK